MQKSNTNLNGWKPHVVYEFVDISRRTLIYWRDHIFPQSEKKYFSTYDILIYKIIKEYSLIRGIQVSRLKKIDWDSLFNDIHSLTFNGMKGKILNIDLSNHTYSILNDLAEVDRSQGHNQFIKLDLYSDEVVDGLMNVGIQ